MLAPDLPQNLGPPCAALVVNARIPARLLKRNASFLHQLHCLNLNSRARTCRSQTCLQFHQTLTSCPTNKRRATLPRPIPSVLLLGRNHSLRRNHDVLGIFPFPGIPFQVRLPSSSNG